MNSNELDTVVSEPTVIKDEPISSAKGFDELTSSVNRMRSDGVLTLFKVITNEANEFVLDMKKRKALKEVLGAEDEDAASWRTAADVIKHFDSVELIRKYPDQAKSTLLTVMSIFPPTAIAGAFISQVPSDTLSKILGVSLTATPDHLLHMLVDHQSNVVAERNALYRVDAPDEEGKRDLVVVCRDDLLYSQLKKLVETDDDSEDAVVGTRDGTVRVLRWEEKKWVYRSKADSVNKKTLVFGDVKGADVGIKLMDVEFEKYGVRYGRLGNCAYIAADRSALRSKGAYEEFLNELASLPIPDEIRKDNKMRLDVKTGLKLALATPLIAKDIYDDSVSVIRQMFFYGAVRFYYDKLEEFLST